MSKTFQLDIRTPEGIAWQGVAQIVTLPGRKGAFQVLINHAPLLTELEPGEVRIVGEDGKEQVFASSGGFAEVRMNLVTVLSETVEAAEKIDTSRAREAKNRALERIKASRLGSGEGVDRLRAEAALARAENRLKIAARL